MFAKSLILASFFMGLAASQFQSVDLTEGKSGRELQGTLETKVNTADPNANGEDTITIRYTLPQTAWLAVGVNPTATVGENALGMANSEVVIGKPADGTVLKYAISAKSGAAVVEQPNQTLIKTSLVQENGNTILTFTKLLAEDGEYTIEADVVNKFIAAFGSSNDFGFHAGYGVQNINVPAATAPAPDTPAPSVAPVVTPTDAPEAETTEAPVVAPTDAPADESASRPSMVVTGPVALCTIVVSYSLATLLLW